MIPKNKPLRNRKYLDSFRDAPCCGCGARDGTVVPAHIRHGHGGGMGLKPDDSYALPLCRGCHDLQHRLGEPAFWAKVWHVKDTDAAIEYAKTAARLRYKGWIERRGGKHGSN